MKINKTALLPPLLALAGFLLSPQFYNELPDKYSHIIYLASIGLAALFPQLFHSTESEAEKSVKTGPTQ